MVIYYSVAWSSVNLRVLRASVVKKLVTISAMKLSKINELLQIEYGMRHVFPNLPALEHLFGRRLMKVRQLPGKARESSALGVIGQSSKRRAEHGIQSRLHVRR